MATETRNSAGAAATTDEAVSKPAKPHRILVPVLAGIALLCVFVSTLSVWVRDSALDSNVWATESGQLMQRQNVRSLVANYVADQAITQTDAEGALANALPPRLKPLAAPGTAAIGRLAVQGVDQALLLPRVQALWVEANKRAHQRLVDFLRGDTKNLQSENGNVVLNLDALVATVASNLGASPAAVEQAQSRIPPVVLVHSDQLAGAQTTVQAIDFLSVWPLLIGLVLAAVAVYLARDRRRTTVRGLAVGMLVMGIVLLVGIQLVGNLVVDSLVKFDSVKPAAHDAWSIYTSLLAESAAAGIAIGILGLVWAWLAGPAGLPARIRRAFAPAFRQHVPATHLTLATLILLVLLVQPVGTPRRTVGVVAVAVLAFIGLEALRRQAVSEHPEATGSLTNGLRELVNRARDHRSPGAGPADRVERLERLAALHDRGALTDREYEREKDLVLSSS
jgi:Short C-terminal domain